MCFSTNGTLEVAEHKRLRCGANGIPKSPSDFVELRGTESQSDSLVLKCRAFHYTLYYDKKKVGPGPEFESGSPDACKQKFATVQQDNQATLPQPFGELIIIVMIIKTLNVYKMPKIKKVVCLLSGGIDSPVAAHMLMKQGVEVIAAHMVTCPATDDVPRQKVERILEKLNIKRSYFVEHGKNLRRIRENCTPRFTCVLCKRQMLREAEKIAKIENADAIVTGDSLGQVASQTLINLETETQAVEIPVIRPLIGFDKEDIIKVAREIGTYEISILKDSGCFAVPKNPATNAKVGDVLEEEGKIRVPRDSCVISGY